MKRWHKSKTMWFNIVSIALALSGVGLVYVDQIGLTAPQAMLAAMAFTSIQTAGNLYLRTITHTAIE